MLSRYAGGAVILVALVAIIVFGVLILTSGDDDGEPAVLGDGPEPTDFYEFVDFVAQAVDQRNVEFLTERVEGVPEVCTEEDVIAATRPGAPPEPVCTEVGIEYERLTVANYGTKGAIVVPSVIIHDIEGYFQSTLANESDALGSGSLQLFATGRPKQADTPNGPVFTAILTQIEESFGFPRRTMRGLDFAYKDGRWIIQGETTASFPIAVDLLAADTATVLYDDWEQYN